MFVFKLLITFSILMHIMCIILCLFSTLSHRVGVLQMSIIIIIIMKCSVGFCHSGSLQGQTETGPPEITGFILTTVWWPTRHCNCSIDTTSHHEQHSNQSEVGFSGRSETGRRAWQEQPRICHPVGRRCVRAYMCRSVFVYIYISVHKSVCVLVYIGVWVCKGFGPCILF